MRDDPIATWKSKFKWYSEKQSLKRYGSNRRQWKLFPGITTLGLLEKIQSNERPTVWTWALQRQDHLHVNAQRHWMESKKKHKNSLAVIGLSWGLEMNWFQEEKASREEDKRHSSPQWIRWMMKMVWEKLHATWQNQESLHKRILGKAVKTLYFGAIGSSLKREACCSSCLHWESGMYENSGWTLPQSSLDSESATCRAKIELAIWSTRSTKPRRKIILGPTKRFEELRRNLEKRRWLQNSWHTTFDSWTAGYNTWKQGQEVDREVRELPAQGIISPGLEPDAEDQQCSAKNRRMWSPTWTTPRSSNFAKILPNSNAIPTEKEV